MANNVAIETGADATVATDDIAGVHYQVAKLAVGTEDSAVRIGHAEDAAHVSGDGGIMLLAVRKDTAAALAGTDGDYIPLIVDANGRLHVETELPAAVLVSGSSPNVAAPQVNSRLHGSSGTDIFPVAIVNVHSADGQATGVGLRVESSPMLFNGTNDDRQRGNVNAQLLASAARTVTTNSPDQINRNHAGVALLLDVTANPGGLETLTVSIAVKLGGVYRAITAFAATAAATNATYVYLLYPGIVETAAVGNVEVQGLMLPRDWRATVTPSAAGSFTYALESSLIV